LADRDFGKNAIDEVCREPSRPKTTPRFPDHTPHPGAS
jgi:hypothetical protein